MRDKLKLRVFFIISVLVLCVSCTIRDYQNDPFYMIKLGEYISKHGIDFFDHFCWIGNLSYTYPHWLYDLFLYYIYDFLGFFGIYLSIILSFIALISVVYYIHLKVHKNEFIALFISFLTVFVLSPFVTARAQVISAILFMLEVYFLDRLSDMGKNKYLIYLMILSLLIANIHGTSWLFFFILFLPMLAQGILYSLLHKKIIFKRLILKKNIYLKKVFIAFLMCFGMGLLSPSRICYSYVFRIMMGDSQKYIIEHLPLVVINNPFFIVIVGVLLLVLIFTNVKVYLYEFLMIFGLLFMSLLSFRHLSFFYLIGVLYISKICVRALKKHNDVTLDILISMFVKKKIIYYGMLLVVIGISCYHFVDKDYYKSSFIDKKEYPVDAVIYIKNNLDVSQLKIYNGYNYGSYLLFNDIPVFIDSRCDLYLKEFNGMKYSLFNEMKDIDFKYEKKFKKYNVSHVILNKHNSFYMTLVKDNNYNIIYQDRFFILFEVIDYE